MSRPDALVIRAALAPLDVDDVAWALERERERERLRARGHDVLAHKWAQAAANLRRATAPPEALSGPGAPPWRVLP